MVTAPSAADVVADAAGGDALAGGEAVADGGALRSGVGVGVGVETTEEPGLLTPTYATAATTIARTSAASAAFRIV
ncbi:MAG TPA: hypothetical protein VEN31_07190 [Candidatus Bathyarchaeia archaeon]|nr:hypothetical protein [Candidatus Bathyarchaeia archaeon]